MSVSMVDGHIDPDTNKMTDKEIIVEALEHCIKGDCSGCPNLATEYCSTPENFQKEVLDLIKKQQAEIENYSHNAKTMSDSIYKMQKLIESQQAEIERLKKLAKDRADVNFDKIVGVVDRARADIKAEAIKEYIKTCEKTAISNAAKVAKATLLEMVGEDK